MLRIDCLLINTEVKETVKQLIGYLGHKGLAEGTDVSFRSMYNELRKNGVEIDLESAAKIYSEALPLEDSRFTSHEDLVYDTGRWFDDVVRNITLQKPKTGEKEIGELSPAQAVVKGIADAFSNNVSGDATTKSILKTLEDVYRSASKRLLGELPNSAVPDKRTTAEIVQEALNNESQGYRNTAEGTINGLAKMHDAVRQQLSELTKEMEATGDHDKVDQWNAYAKSLEDASYSLMFTSAEAKAVLHGAMRDGGFTKLSKTGNEIVDWEKLAGTRNSYEQLRQDVVDSLKKNGFTEDIGHRVADSMSKEFRDIRGKIVDTANKEQQRLSDSWTKTPNAPGAPKDVVTERLQRWENYKLLTEDPTKPLTFAKNEANRIVSGAIKDLGFTKQVNGRDVIDYEKLADSARTKYDVQALVKKALEAQGYDHATAQEVSASIQEMSNEFFGKVADYVKAREAKTEDTWLQQNNVPVQPMSLKDLVDLRMKQSGQHSQIVGNNAGHMSLKKHEGQRILSETLKAGEFGKDTANGKQIDWVKLASMKPTDVQLTQMVADHLQAEGVSPYNANVAAGAIRDVYTDLAADIAAHTQKTLDARQFALDRESVKRKTDLHRLAELHDMGIFNGSHDRLLAHILGIEQSDIQAVQGIKNYAEKLSKLRQIMSGNDFIVPSMVHTLNREIQNILAPVIENKSKAMKMVSALNKIYQVENSMLISTHGNLLENHLSGAMELLTTNLSQRLKLGKELGGMKGQDWQLMKDMYRHIAAGGAEYGLAPYQVGGNKGRLTDKYNIHQMQGADWSRPGTWAKGLATAVLTIPRTFLSGADGAVKIGLMNAHMKSAVVDAIMANSDGQVDRDTAVQMYNDAIYGPGQLAAAKQKARQIYQNIGMKYVSEKELNITANELLRENLIQNRIVKAEELQDLMDNSFREAGLGMGHEANNFFSERQQAWKQSLNRKEQVALSENDWDKAARIRLGNTILNDVVFRFAASRFNWAWIRAQQSGVGLLTGLYHYSITGKKFKNVELIADKEERVAKMNEMATEYQAARQKLARGAVGLGISAAAYLAAKAIAKAMNPDEEDPTQKMYDELKGNFPAKALFLKVAPLWMLQSYEYNETKQGEPFDRMIAATGKDFINLTNVGDKHDISVQLFEGIKNISDGKSEKMRGRGYAELGKAMNNFIPHVPLYKQGKNVGQFVNWMGGGEPKPMPPFPNNFWQGMLYGGIIQDVFGHVSAEHLPQSLEAWGIQPEVKEDTGY
jgi:hypothetical protein